MLYTDVYRDVFQFHKERMRAEMTPAFWDDTCRMMIEICDKYDNHDFVVDLLAVVFSELERRRMHG